MEKEKLYGELNELIAKASKGNAGAEGILVRRYDALIRKTASRYTSENPSCSFEDLYQEARIGFVLGLRSFDYEKGTAFVSWVTYSMNVEIRKCLSKNSRLVQLPKWRLEDMSRVAKAVSELEADAERVSVSRLLENAGLAGMTKSHVEDALLYLRTSSEVSLDAPVSDGSDEREKICFVPSGEDTESLVERKCLLEKVSQMIESLEESERFVMLHRLGLGVEKMPDRAIADRLGITARGVRSIWERNRDLIRTTLAA